MTCNYQHWIFPYLDGRLQAPQRHKLEAHVIGCAVCMKESKASIEVIQTLRSLKIWAGVRAALADDLRWKKGISPKQVEQAHPVRKKEQKYEIIRKPKISDTEKS